MGSYILRRLLLAFPLLLAVTIVCFAILHLTPGDPVTFLYGTDATPAELARARAMWGLDDPIHIQYLKWLWNFMHGNLGRSYVDGRPVLDIIMERVPATLTLTLTAFVLALVVGVGLGVLSAMRSLSLVDYLANLLATTLYSTPSFWLALLLIMLFAVQLKWLPSSGMISVDGPSSLGDRLAHLVLPAFVLAFREIGRLIRFTRASMLDVLRQDYLRTAVAKGLPASRMILRHAFPNALIPIITVVGLTLPTLLAGSIVVESVFSWPGMGMLAWDAAKARNYGILMGDIVLVGALVIIGNLIADVAYSVADPRIRYGKGEASAA